MSSDIRPLPPPIEPMLAKVAERVPDGPYLYEPKWDGFRAIVFRDGDTLYIQSRDLRPFDRYFPDLHDALLARLPRRCVLDGEIVIATPHGLDFDALQMRLHPAASRVALLARETPSSIVFFDILCEGDQNLCELPLAERRERLEAVVGPLAPPIHLTPASMDRAVADDWFRRFEGAGLDGVMAKPLNGIYEPNKRVMLKIKHERDCDCIVAGFRWHKDAKGSAVGSLLLGLYDDQEQLQHVGVCASFPMAKRRELVGFLSPHRTTIERHPWKDWAQVEEGGGEEGHRRPGAPSRWSQGKDLSWEPLQPELVLQIAYDHMQGTRFRHIAQFRRWRPDKQPRDCTFEQVAVVRPLELAQVFQQGR